LPIRRCCAASVAAAVKCQFKDAGFDVHMTKPIDMDELTVPLEFLLVGG
jgi:hypothetical protein